MSLGKVYYDPKHAAGFGSVEKLVKASTRKHKKQDVEEWLAGQNTYTLHKPVRKRFPRIPYTVTNIDDMWEMDLADLRELLQACDQIWRPAQQVIRGQGKSVVFSCRGKHTENAPGTDGLLLP